MSFVLPAEIVLASGNQGKLKELSELLSDCPNTLRLQSEFGVEPADEPACTFIENALLKARHAAARTGLAALADDSGLSVDALGGAPGSVLLDTPVNHQMMHVIVPVLSRTLRALHPMNAVPRSTAQSFYFGMRTTPSPLLRAAFGEE